MRTKEGLPIVQQSTVEDFVEGKHLLDQTGVLKLIEDFQQEQPALAGFVYNLSRNVPPNQQAMQLYAVQIYNLLITEARIQEGSYNSNKK